MFWIGLFSGIVFYLIFTLIAVAVAKRKVKKQKENQKNYDTIVKAEIEKNSNNRY